MVGRLLSYWDGPTCENHWMNLTIQKILYNHPVIKIPTGICNIFSYWYHLIPSGQKTSTTWWVFVWRSPQIPPGKRVQRSSSSAGIPCLSEAPGGSIPCSNACIAVVVRSCVTKSFGMDGFRMTLKIVEGFKCFRVEGFKCFRNHFGKIWVKMGSSSPIFKVNIPNIFELPPPSWGWWIQEPFWKETRRQSETTKNSLIFWGRQDWMSIPEL